MTEDTPHETTNAESTSDRADAVSDGELAQQERALAERGTPYARATVVRREAPVSANVGDRALVTTDGDLVGWVGGAACAQSRVESEARTAIAEGEPRLIGLAPEPAAIDRPGLEAFPMTCQSEGTLEVFIEPVVPTTTLLVVGGSPVANSLVRLASELAIDVTVVDPDGGGGTVPDDVTVLSTLEPESIAEAVGPAPLVVAASMGEYDARAVAAGVLADAPYIGLVASDARAETVVERAAGLLDRDSESVRDAITNPAGVDISAKTGAEIAASVLAELIDVRANTGAVTASSRVSESLEDAATATDAGDQASGACCGGGVSETETATTDATDSNSVNEPNDVTDEPAVDPVCDMTVDPDDAPSVTHEGTTYYFCCHGCADSFRADPGDYLETVEDGELMSP
ncbi:XdhC family protein [Natronorubrum texcoconense]|uniref:Xanthine dehydrogenase accessory factor n=1 Tax=Natronorubrum texcoconense TaxID=1095776 RepID=A0A1G8X8F7_9EURY|nr:XdhC family protein [Natronorubrum texcoconense]SDJ86731.1 xanthine dehydrogenase accessory factor [Natronorubrum texcoconense]